MMLCGIALQIVSVLSLSQADPTASPDPAISITESEQGQVSLADDRVHELSGITYVGGDRYLIASDKGGRIVEATISIDRATGLITEATLSDPLPLKGHRDLEDLAYDAASDSLWVVDEATTTIARHTLAGEKIEAFNLQASFPRPRSNLGLESLALARGGKHLWTINEEALSNDGPRASTDEGTRVRLQSLLFDGTPSATYHYHTDPHTGSNNLLKRAQCGVSGLVALPDGRLIVLERMLGGEGIPVFRNRLYLVNPKRTLDSGDGKPSKLDKHLLIEIAAGLANFEGITLGPTLDNGDRTLLLIADDGGGKTNPQSLLALRIAGLENVQSP